MSIDKPLGMSMPVAKNPLAQAVEVSIMPEPVTTEMEDGSYEVDFGDPLALVPQDEHYDNLAEILEDDYLDELATELIADFIADRDSRAGWEETYLKGLDLLGLEFEERTKPWDGACGVFHPMLAEAVVRFQSQTIQEIFPASGPVKISIAGDKTTERVKQGQRVGDFMNYCATKKMVEYRNETEKLLFSLPIAGSSFRKVYQDTNYNRPSSMFVPAEDFVVAYGTSDLTTCDRATHVMRRTHNELRKSQVSGFYSDIELQDPQPEYSEIQRKYDEMKGDKATYDRDSRHTLLEMQVNLDLEGFEDKKDGENTGIGLPYVVTVEKTSSKILAIRRNWVENDEKSEKREYFVHYQYLPGLGFYGFGLVSMIGGLTSSATSLLRQLIDSGTLANLPGGLKARGLRIKGDSSPIAPGEFRDVDVPSGTIRDNISYLPYKEPSGVLYQLLIDIVQEGRRFASAADVKAADMNAEAPVGTTLAILEREMKVLSAIQARIHFSMGRELVMLGDLIKEHGPEEYPYEVAGNYTIREDFDDRVDIIPVSDPNAGTMAQRIMTGQAALQLAGTAPQLYNMPLIHRKMIEALGMQDAEKIIPMDDDLLPTDPVSENQALITGKPVKAFLYQDHEAHIQTHISAMQNPQMMELMQMNPQAKAVAAAGAAHIAEHLAYAYRRKIEEELGVELPAEDQPLPEDIELRLSRLVAPAAAQLTGKAQQQKQAEENAKKQEDPIIKLQQEEVAVKRAKVEGDNQAKMAGIVKDLKKHEDTMGLKRREMDHKERIDGAKLAVDVASDQLDSADKAAERASREQTEGFKIGLDIARGMTKGDSNGSGKQ